MKRIVLIFCGYTSLSLGIVGIFLPLFPTTPFLLLASVCFLRGSVRLHSWLINYRLFGSYILAYQRFKAVSRSAKVLSIALLWATILFSVIFVVSAAWLKALLLLIAIGVSIHLIRLKTLTREMRETLNQERFSANAPLWREKGQKMADANTEDVAA